MALLVNNSANVKNVETYISSTGILAVLKGLYVDT